MFLFSLCSLRFGLGVDKVKPKANKGWIADSMFVSILPNSENPEPKIQVFLSDKFIEILNK